MGCSYSWRGSLRRCFTTSQWNVEGGRQCVAVAGLLVFLSFGYFDGRWIDGLGLAVGIL